MIKIVGLVKRRPDLTREQFKDYWLKNHSKLEKESAEKKFLPNSKKLASAPRAETSSL